MPFELLIGIKQHHQTQLFALFRMVHFFTWLPFKLITESSLHSMKFDKIGGGAHVTIKSLIKRYPNSKYIVDVFCIEITLHFHFSFDFCVLKNAQTSNHS